MDNEWLVFYDYYDKESVNCPDAIKVLASSKDEAFNKAMAKLCLEGLDFKIKECIKFESCFDYR